MLGSCSCLTINNNRCNGTYQLHTLIFRDPYAPSNLEQADICKAHYDQLCLNMLERIRENTMKIANLISQKSRERKIAKEYGNFYNETRIQQKIEDLIEQQKHMQTRECRNFLCMKDLTTLDQNEKLFSVHSFALNGKRQYTFYFCSLKCFGFMKGQCGIKIPINTGQTILVAER